jgi:hypothetical protein
VTAGRRPRRYVELVHSAADGARPPVVVGCWVVVADRAGAKPLTLARVVAGPQYVHQDGHAIGEVWELHTGEQHNHMELTALDLRALVDEGRAVLEALRAGSRSPEYDEIRLRVHRAACLARRCRDGLRDAVPVLDALDVIDQLISQTSDALRELVRVRLPNVARVLYLVGLCELARDPAWHSGDPAHPHPRLKEMT